MFQVPLNIDVISVKLNYYFFDSQCFPNNFMVFAPSFVLGNEYEDFSLKSSSGNRA